MILDPHIATIAVLTLLAGWLMASAGLQKSALEWKRRRRICPSCGREVVGAGCTCAAAVNETPATPAAISSAVFQTLFM